jgi:nucleotide-binding universal stress UspA family protein
MKTILFPTDFSENANHAFRFAKMIVKAKNTKLILLHTYDLPLVAPVNDFTSRGQTMSIIDNDLRVAAYEQMKIHTNELDLKYDDYEVLVKEGSTVGEISYCCKKNNIDLIVMGTKGTTNSRDFLMGSVTAKVITKVKIPVLAVPESAKIQPFKKIVFAVDLMYNSTEQIKKAIKFCELNSCSLTFLHIEIGSEKEGVELKELKEIIGNNTKLELQLTLTSAETVQKGISSYLEENKTDLLILSNHTKSFFEKLFHKSVSKEMLLHGSVPLLIFSDEIHPMVFF